MNLPIFIVGGGGHAKVLIDMLRLRSMKILGITDTDSIRIGNDVLGISVLGNDEVLSGYAPESLLLVNGVGSIHLPKTRMTVFEKFKERGFTFATVIHPAAVVAADVVLGEGVQIMAGAVIQPGSRIGMNTIVNTKASVDHDCLIGNHVHLSPGTTLSGGVHIGDVVHLGTGATVIQGVTIGRNSLIGAGSVVVTDVPDNAEFAGVPAKKK
jgi:sugar O-acyltransferase (sialic acid O-acetyltransferase NeuD family)